MNDNLNCELHEAHEDITIPLATTACVQGIKDLAVECSTDQIAQVGSMAVEIHAQFPQFGCLNVLASAVGGNTFPPCDEACK